MPPKIVIYTAAALFNARETFFNSLLVESLEKLGYQTIFPQRDGFEFQNLGRALQGKIPDDQINSAVLNIIYFLDLGVFLPKCDVLLANFDEPLDEGVVVEATFSKFLGKFVIGWRTDVRSPYGSSDDLFGGMHFFPAYQTHVFITQYMPCPTPPDREIQMNLLAEKIDQTIQEKVFHQVHNHQENTHFQQILEGANLLFHELKDYHTTDALNTITARYLENQKRLEDIRPIIRR